MEPMDENTSSTPAVQQPEGTTAATASEAQPTDARPSWLPEKFKSAEEFRKAYDSLERKLSSGKPRTTDQQPTGDQEQPATGSDSSTDQQQQQPATRQAENALKAAGLDLEAFNAEYQRNGSLSQASYDRLVNAGFPRSMVDAYVAGQQAIAEKHLNSILAETGGTREAYQEMAEWARREVPAEEVRAYDAIMTSGDPAAARFAARAMYQRFLANAPREPKLIGGDQRPAESGERFTSNQQVVEAMRDPRYKTDAKYRETVWRKLDRSDVFQHGGRQ